MAGGRWTPPALFRAVYGSLDPHTAMEEALGNYQDRGIPISRAMPLVVVAVHFKLKAVLDVTAAAFLNHLGLSTAALTQLDWRAEQLAGREALTQAIWPFGLCRGIRGDDCRVRTRSRWKEHRGLPTTASQGKFAEN
jgi:RES domain-containing protein